MRKDLTYLGKIFYVTEEYEDITDAIYTKGRSLSPGKRLYFESADFEVEGSIVVERHINNSPDGIPERLRLYNIINRHKGMSIDQAKHYKDCILRAGFDYPVAIAETDKMIKKEGVDYTLSWLEKMANEMEACDTGIEDAMHSNNRGESFPPTYGFHKVDDMYGGKFETPWFLKQSEQVQRLLTTPQRCKNLYQIKKLGKGCYEADKEPDRKSYQKVYLSMSNVQRQIFWENYIQRKSQIMENYQLSNTGKALVKRIQNSRKSQLPRLKANLVKLQKGQIKVSNPPSDEEWEVLWWYYSRRG
jgi:hypothetical protein